MFIMRHGEALFDAPDARRSLSEQGVVQARKSAAWLTEQLSGRPVNIWASPFRRAQQTAAIVADQLSSPVKTHDWLTPDVTIDHVMTAWEPLWMRSSEEAIWLWVSHMPLVGKLVGALCEGRAQAGLHFSPAQVVQLKADVGALGCATQMNVFRPDS